MEYDVEGYKQLVRAVFGSPNSEVLPVAARIPLQDMVAGVLWTLEKREQEVLECRFALRGASCQTLEVIGRHFHVTGERIRQVEARALRKLRRTSRSSLLRPYLLETG